MSEMQRAILQGVVAQWGYGKSGNWKFLHSTADEHTKALEAAATPGPWSPSKYYRTNIVSDSTGQILCQSMNAANREFIAHARTAVPALVAAVERVQALHTPWTNPTGHPYCKECLLAHPCPTIRALETKP